MHNHPHDATEPQEAHMNKEKAESSGMSEDHFPGHLDAGKVLLWLSRQIAATELGASLLSALEVPADDPRSRLRTRDQQAALR
jgi:hypothetical protein